MRTLIKNLATSLMVASVLSIPAVSYADDTEIYFAKANAENSENKPSANVLFLIDTSGSMCDPRAGWNTNRNCNNEYTPMVALRSAFAAMVNGLEEDVKIGLAKFNGGYDTSGYGGYVFYPVSELDEDKKAEIIGVVDNLQGTSNTPTMEAYSEAARYMLGMAPTDYAKRGEAIENSPRRAVNITRQCNKNGKNCEYFSSGAYDSPINMSNQCESNHIIVMTDGAPTQDSDHSKVTNISGGSCHSASGFFGTSHEKNSFACQAKLAEFLQGESPKGKKPIKTWQIAFGVGKDSNEVKNIRKVAEAGGTDNVRYADDADELAQAFLDILDLIDKDSRSIAAPGVAVNTMNRFQHLDELYYAVFQPAESSFWEGNLKRYQLKNQKIHGQNGVAVDETTGYFSADSRSFWSSVDDGADANKGGARENIGARKLFYTDQTRGTVKQLTWNSTNEPSNSFFGLTGANAATNRTLMLESLKTMWGDPMHSVPLMVNYGQDENYVFVSTNGGMLHIIDTEDGGEAAAFMPYEFFKQATKFTTNKPALNYDNTRALYGLDGSWIAWRKPGETLEDKPEKVYIYGGMRRGGKDYYALDVTTPSSPKMKWQISSGDEGFERLGQTWSTPTLTKVKTATGNVPALIFGGGYSPDDHDGPQHSRSAADKEGNAIYIVNAEDGSLIWSALSTAEMKWAIPGGISVVDIDFDGVADHLYFGDLGGQLFRADMSGTGQKPSVTRIADLGGTAADHRRFFEAPAVAYAKSGVKNLLYVVAGSGYRAHPLDEDTDEGIFVVIDDGALQESSSDMATLENMANVVTNAVETDDRGWYYLFEEESERLGEKALSSPVIFDNKIMFSTYAPTEDQEYDNPCAVRYGGAYLHTVNMRTGAPASLTGDAPDSRSQSLDQSTPPPTPTLLVDEEGNLVIVVGPEVVGEGDLGDPNLRKRRWMQLPKDEANKFRAIAEGTLEEEDADE